MISGPRVYLIYHPYARARALMARPWSARCYGVARPREGSRPNSIGGLGRAFTPAFRAGSLSLNPWRVGAEESAAARMVSAGAMLLDRLGPPGSEFRFIDFRPPRLALLSAIHAREGAAGQAVVCPLLRGSSPTRGVAPKQHRGLGRALTPAFRAGSLYPLARGCRRSWRGEGCNYGLWLRRRRKLCHDPIATARCCSTGSGPLGFCFFFFR